MQKERDRRAGLNTAGYLTGYRGSPLGGLDQQFIRAGRQLAAADVKFQPGINEELAATALWGTQQAELRGEGKFDGVFGPLVRQGSGRRPLRRRVPPCQSLRHLEDRRRAGADGRRPHRGILDHRASVRVHFIDVMIPILNPAGVQEVLDYGLYGWAMSRFTGAWTALKTCTRRRIDGGDRREPRSGQHRYSD